MTRAGRTLLRSTKSISSKGIHFGQAGTIQLHPSHGQAGIWFSTSPYRPDNGNSPFKADSTKTLAIYSNVSNTMLRTELSKRFNTVEHVLAALYGMNVTHAVCHVETGDKGEIPIMDGSALDFARALQEAGITVTSDDVPYIAVKKPIRVEGKDGSYALLEPINSAERKFDINVRVEFGHESENASFTIDWSDDSHDTFIREISPARTFAYEHEIEKLHQMGMGIGGTLENCVIYSKCGQPINPPLRFANERARHKLLDVIGDLSLCSGRLIARYEGYKMGHTLNHKCVQALFAHSANFQVL